MLDRIHSALQEFTYDPDLGAQALRDLREEDVAAFRDGAFSVLFEGDAGPGHKDMMRLVRETGVDFLPKLLDPNIELPHALQAAKTLCESEPGVDVRLVRMLLHPTITENPRAVSRTLDVLENLPAMPRLVPILMQVYRVAPKQVRARIATMIGRTHRNEEWVDQRLSDADSRVRANIVELYIGHSSQLAIDVFRRGLGDSAPRVIANAALGLYYAAAAQALRFLGEEMAASESANERAAAAWAMGQTRDLRFRQVLSRLMRDKDTMVRRQSIRGLAILRREEAVQANTASATQGPDGQEWLAREVTVESKLRYRGPAGDAHYEVRVQRLLPGAEAHSGAGTAFPGVRPIEIHAYENNEPVLDYELHESDPRQLPGLYTLTFQSKFPAREPLVSVQYRAHNGDYKPA